jgi:hypothetical protein
MAYDKLTQYYANQNTKKLRELLRRDYGARCYRITRQDEIHVYGQMPNSIVTGWYLLGSKHSVATDYMPLQPIT